MTTNGAGLEGLLQEMADRIRRLEARDAERTTQQFDDWLVRQADNGDLIAEQEDGTTVIVASRPVDDGDSG